jgi:hypothetical protein
MRVCAMCLIFHCVNCVAVVLECAMDNFLVHRYCTYIIRGRWHRGNIKLFRFKLQRTAVYPQHHHILTQQQCHIAKPPHFRTSAPSHSHIATTLQQRNTPAVPHHLRTPHCYTNTHTALPLHRYTATPPHNTATPPHHTATSPHRHTSAPPYRRSATTPNYRSGTSPAELPHRAAAATCCCCRCCAMRVSERVRVKL